MSPRHAPPPHDGSLGAEAVFAGQVDASTARADDVLLWDDDAVILRVAVALRAGEAEDPAAA